MTAQPLTPVPAHAVDAARILADTWQGYVETQTALGDCQRPGCDGTLRATPAIITGSVVWLEAECDTCYLGVAFPNGKRHTRPDWTVRPLRAVPDPPPDLGTDEDGQRVRDWRERQHAD